MVLDVVKGLLDLVEHGAEHLDAKVIKVNLVEVEAVDGVAHATSAHEKHGGAQALRDLRV
jgi:hypothetical protein